MAQCRGFEDGGVGLEALKAAGMEVVDVKLMDGYPRRNKKSDDEDDEDDEDDVNIQSIHEDSNQEESFFSFNYFKNQFVG